MSQPSKTTQPCGATSPSPDAGCGSTTLAPAGSANGKSARLRASASTSVPARARLRTTRCPLVTCSTAVDGVDQPRVCRRRRPTPGGRPPQLRVGVLVEPALGRQRRADGVVTAGSVLLDALEPELVAVVDARHPGQEAEQGHRVRQCRWSRTWLATRVTSWLPTKVIGTKCSRSSRVPPQRPVQLVEVDVVSSEDQTAFHSSYCVTESRPESLDVADVVAVDHLADEPGVAELRAHRGSTAAQNTRGTAYAASSRQPSMPRRSQCSMTSRDVVLHARRARG